MQINYFAENGVELPRIRKQIVRRWILLVLAEMGRSLGELSFMFTDSNGILTANQQYLDHDYYTDVITFPNEPTFPKASTEENAIYGDILICLDVVQENAQELNVPFSEELARVMIHGVLHLCGLNDHSEEEQQAMRLAEDRALIQIDRLLDGKELLR